MAPICGNSKTELAQPLTGKADIGNRQNHVIQRVPGSCSCFAH
jgi:hypothetical protein